MREKVGIEGVKGKLKLIPYFVVNGVVRTAGMAQGFAELIGEALVKTKLGVK